MDVSEGEYEAAVRELACLIDRDTCPSPGESDYERVNALVNAVVAYEREHDPIAPPTAAAMDLFRREQAGETVNWDAVTLCREVSIQ